MSKLVECTCILCGRKTIKYLSNAKVERYCSPECAMLARIIDMDSEYLVTILRQSAGIMIKCKNCGKLFPASPRSLKRNKRFCSDDCWRRYYHGKNCHNWNGGSSYEPYSPEFSKEYKTLVKELYSNECVVCHAKNELDIHHIDYNKKNNHISNLIPLCDKCHGKSNFDRYNWELWFKYYIWGVIKL